MTWRRWGAAAGVLVLLTAALHGSQDAGRRARLVYDRAVALEGEGNDAAALALLWEAAALAPGDADIQNRLGESLARLGALDAAADAFGRAAALNPEFRKAANNRVLTLVQAGRSGEAIAWARAALAERPHDAERRFTLGLAQAEADVEAAIVTFRSVLAVAPRHVLARYNLAQALQRTDRFAAAVQELERAIGIEPRPEALYALGVLHWHRGDLGGAAAALRRALAAQPDYAEAQRALGVVLEQQGDLTAAAEALRRAVSLQPEVPAGHLALARVLERRGEAADAEAARKEAERVRQQTERERQALVLTAVGRGRFERGDLLGALDDLRRAAHTVDTYAPAHYQLGLVLRALDQPEAARAAFARARQLNPALRPPPDDR